MGFFSSITKPFKKVFDVGKDIVSGVVNSVIDAPLDAIGTVGNIVGGVLGNNSQTAANEANAALAREQFEWQKDYAKNRLQWQVEDAKKAGLHPMVAAGLSPSSFSPVSAAQSPVDYDWVGQAGQSLAYAAAKAKTNKQQQMAFDYQMQLGEEQLNGIRLDNELKMMEIMSELARLTQTGPAAPDLNGGNNLLGGQNDSPFPHGNTYTDNTRPLLELGRIGDTLVEYINPDLADSVNEDMLKKLAVRIASEGQNARTALQAFRHFTKREQAAVLRGDADIVRDVLTGSWQFKWMPHMKPRKNSDGSISGRIIW